MQFSYPRIGHLKSASIGFSGSGDNTIVAAVASKIIAIQRIWLVVAGATSLIFKDGASISLSGAVPMAANGGLTFDTTGDPWFFTTAGNAFIINSSNAVQISGRVYYTIST